MAYNMLLQAPMVRLGIVSALALLGACVQPTLPEQQADAPDAMPPAPDAMLDLDCEPRIQQVPSGYHNPGTECLSCHNGQQAGAPIYRLAGTAYQRDGATPQVGGTIIVIDANGTVVKLPTAQNGNFYTSLNLIPPYITMTSMCPGDNTPMITNFVDGDCNSCHRNDGTDPGLVKFP